MAAMNDADFIISRDAKAFEKAKLRKLTTAEYLAIAD